VNVVAVVLTWNPTRYDRVGLLEQTVESLRPADRVIVVDNGSTDGTTFPDSWSVWRNGGPVTTSGQGTLCCLRVAAGAGADVAVISDDDMVWSDGWRDELEAFWFEPPEKVLLAGGHLEPEFPWNEIRHVHDGWLERESTGAASWTTNDPARLAGYGASVTTLLQGTWDVPVCRVVRSDGWKIGQLDLAEHIGGESTWGNGTVAHWGWDVESVRARLR
jgi:hypothetical protein